MGRQPQFIKVQKSLSGINYPADKKQLVEHARGNGADKATLSALEGIPDRTYDGPSAVSKAVAKS
jgi:hypothetical protein